jgi:hypothetical protein
LQAEMQAQMTAQMLAGELDPADPADLPSCCNDLQTWGETGQLCKTSLDHPGLLAWAPAPDVWVLSEAPAADPPGTGHTTSPTAPPGALWRPPTHR